MDRAELYDKMAQRKSKPKDFQPYDGNNGRVNRCAQMIFNGKLRSGGTLIDIGGGIGDLGAACRENFDTRIVVDISETNLKAAKAKGNSTFIVDVDKSDLPFADGCADLITALDFIEHIVDPEHFARECFRVLKPSGEVFINTPNIRFWKHIEQLWKTGSFPHTSGDREVYHGGHLAFFTYHDLREIFEGAGFTSTEQVKDEEGFCAPPQMWISALQPKNQLDFYRLNLELGCPNLLYKAIRP